MLDVGQVLARLHAQHRAMVVELEGYRGLGPPVKRLRTPASVRRAPPAFGRHTQAVLRERGLDPDRFETALAVRRG